MCGTICGAVPGADGDPRPSVPVGAVPWCTCEALCPLLLPGAALGLGVLGVLGGSWALAGKALNKEACLDSQRVSVPNRWVSPGGIWVGRHHPARPGWGGTSRLCVGET